MFPYSVKPNLHKAENVEAEKFLFFHWFLVPVAAENSSSEKYRLVRLFEARQFPAWLRFGFDLEAFCCP